MSVHCASLTMTMATPLIWCLKIPCHNLPMPTNHIAFFLNYGSTSPAISTHHVIWWLRFICCSLQNEKIVVCTSIQQNLVLKCSSSQFILMLTFPSTWSSTMVFGLEGLKLKNIIQLKQYFFAMMHGERNLLHDCLDDIAFCLTI